MHPDKEEQTSVSRVEVDSAAFARDKLTKELVLVMVHGKVCNTLSMRGIVDTCRKTARYIQNTNEVENYYC